LQSKAWIKENEPHDECTQKGRSHGAQEALPIGRLVPRLVSNQVFIAKARTADELVSEGDVDKLHADR